MSWTENHPWKSAIIASIVFICGAFIIYIAKWYTPEKGFTDFFLWLPLYLLVLWIPVTLIELGNKLKKNKN